MDVDNKFRTYLKKTDYDPFKESTEVTMSELAKEVRKSSALVTRISKVVQHDIQ